jgi:hypothetical protein
MFPYVDIAVFVVLYTAKQLHLSLVSSRATAITSSKLQARKLHGTWKTCEARIHELTMPTLFERAASATSHSFNVGTTPHDSPRMARPVFSLMHAPSFLARLPAVQRH